MILQGSNYCPLHVGKVISNKKFGIQGDDTGDNISEKNPLYCELTGIYWLWKNMTADYYGLMHYRRIFTIQKDYLLKKILLKGKIMLRGLFSAFRPLNSHGFRIEYFAGTEANYRKHAMAFNDKVEKLLQQGINIIVPSPQYCFLPVSVTFSPESPIWAKQIIERIATIKYPEFAEYYRKSFGRHYVYQRNMFIMDKFTFNEYCTILFTLLQTFEQEIINEKYIIDIKKEKSMSCVIGYLGELITNAYIQYCIARGKKIKTLPLMTFDNSHEYAR